MIKETGYIAYRKAVVSCPRVDLGSIAVSAAKADPTSVFVGYADNLRPSGFSPVRGLAPRAW